MDIRKVMVLGSNSFSGSHCVAHFLNQGCRVIGISRSPEYSPVFLPYLYKSRKRPSLFAFHQLNLNKDLDKIVGLIDEVVPDLIVNFVAQGNVQFSWDSPRQWFETNCLGVGNLAECLKGREYLRKWIQISTPEVYGPCQDFKETLTQYNPTSPYAASKAAGDLYLLTLFKKYGFPVVFIRSTNVYGIHQQLYRIIPKTIVFIKKGWRLPLHDGGKAVRSFIHIRDIADGIFRAVGYGSTGEAYHFSSGEYVSIRQLVEMICLQMSVKFEEVVRISSERTAQDAVYDLNCDKARKRLGWRPLIQLEDSIREVISWVTDNWEEISKLPTDYIHQE